MKSRCTFAQSEKIMFTFSYFVAKLIQYAVKTFQKQMCCKMSFVWVQLLFSSTWLDFV